MPCNILPASFVVCSGAPPPEVCTGVPLEVVLLELSINFEDVLVLDVPVLNAGLVYGLVSTLCENEVSGSYL